MHLIYILYSLSLEEIQFCIGSMKAELDLPLFLTSLRVAALDVASHADYCKGINASQAKEERQEAINLKNKAVQDVLLLQRAEGENNHRGCSCCFHVNARESFSRNPAIREI